MRTALSLWSLVTDMSAPSLWAYLDPGTGSMLFQVLIAGILSAAFFARSTLQWLMGTLRARHRGT